MMFLLETLVKGTKRNAEFTVTLLGLWDTSALYLLVLHE